MSPCCPGYHQPWKAIHSISPKDDGDDHGDEGDDGDEEEVDGGKDLKKLFSAYRGTPLQGKKYLRSGIIQVIVPRFVILSLQMHVFVCMYGGWRMVVVGWWVVMVVIWTML